MQYKLWSFWNKLHFVFLWKIQQLLSDPCSQVRLTFKTEKQDKSRAWVAFPAKAFRVNRLFHVHTHKHSLYLTSFTITCRPVSPTAVSLKLVSSDLQCVSHFQNRPFMLCILIMRGRRKNRKQWEEAIISYRLTQKECSVCAYVTIHLCVLLWLYMGEEEVTKRN